MDRHPPAFTRTGLELLALRAARLHELHTLLLSKEQETARLCGEYLAAGCQILGLPSGVIGELDEGSYRILALRHSEESPLRVGDRLPLADGFCGQALQRTVAVPHRRAGGAELACHPAHAALNLEAYIAAPLWANDRAHGSIAFGSTTARMHAFATEDIEFLELMAKALGNIIERDRLDRERRAAEQNRIQAMTLFSTAFTHAPIGMALVGADGRWLRVNRSLCELVGYTEEELLATDFQTITHADDLELDLGLLHKMLEGSIREYEIEKRYIRKDGQTIWVLLSVSLVRNDDGSPRYFVSQVQDINDHKALVAELEARKRELEEANLKLRELATTDPLTGLANRRTFLERLESELDRASSTRAPLSLLMIDVDHFKVYNDRYGHLMGDAMLKAVGLHLRSALRSSDEIGRYGGEEFIVLLPGTNEVRALAIAERLRETIAGLQGGGVGITISIGMHAVTPNYSGARLDPAEVIAAADRALYRAKDLGRNRVELA